jgi:hypothetical protein
MVGLMAGKGERRPGKQRVKRRTEKHRVHMDNVNRIFTALLTQP